LFLFLLVCACILIFRGTILTVVLQYIESLPHQTKIFSTSAPQEKLEQKFGGRRGGTRLVWAFQQDKDDNGK
jgi:hypothetical protein